MSWRRRRRWGWIDGTGSGVFCGIGVTKSRTVIPKKPPDPLLSLDLLQRVGGRSSHERVLMLREADERLVSDVGPAADATQCECGIRGRRVVAHGIGQSVDARLRGG